MEECLNARERRILEMTFNKEETFSIDKNELKINLIHENSIKHAVMKTLKYGGRLFEKRYENYVPVEAINKVRKELSEKSEFTFSYFIKEHYSGYPKIYDVIFSVNKISDCLDVNLS